MKDILLAILGIAGAAAGIWYAALRYARRENVPLPPSPAFEKQKETTRVELAVETERVDAETREALDQPRAKLVADAHALADKYLARLRRQK